MLKLISIVLLSISGVSQLHAQDVVLLKDLQEYSIGKFINILADQHGNYTIDDVLLPQTQSQFLPSDRETVGYGYTDTVYWISFKLKNGLSYDNEWLITVQYHPLDSVDLYSRTGETGSIKHTAGGDLLPLSKRPFRHIFHIFPVTLKAQEEKQFFIRVASQSSMLMPLKVTTIDALEQQDTGIYFFYGVFAGAVVLIILYNLLLSIFLHDRANLFYSLMVGFFGFYQLAVEGFINFFFLPDSPALANLLNPLSGLMAIFWGMIFTRLFLMTKRFAPKIDKILFAMIVIMGLVLVSFPFMRLITAARIINLFGILNLIVALTSSAIVLKKGFRPAFYFFLGWISFFIGSTGPLSRNMGIVYSSFMAQHGMTVGLFGLIVLLGIALANRIKILRVESENAQRKSLDQMPAAICMVNADLKITLVNKVAEAIFDIDAERVFGKSLLRVMGEEYREFVTWVEHCFKQQINEVREVNLKLASGKAVSLQASLSFLHDDLGGNIGLAIYFVDLSEIKEQQAYLERSALKIKDAMEKISDGDLSEMLEKEADDEVGEIIESINNTTGSFQMLIKQVKQSSEQVRQSAQILKEFSQKLVEGANLQAELASESNTEMLHLTDSISKVSYAMEEMTGDVTETASSIVQLGSMSSNVIGHLDEMNGSVEQVDEAMAGIVDSIENVALSVAKVHKLSSQASNEASQGHGAVDRTFQGVQDVYNEMDNIAQIINTLAENATAIRKIIAMIEEIADQTNLLALNAAIVAAQAGDAGRGFSVVASEVRALAGRSVQSTKDITTLIGKLDDSMLEAVEAVDRGARTTAVGMELATGAASAIENVMNAVVETAEVIDQIAIATETQRANLDVVDDSMSILHQTNTEVRNSINEQAEGVNRIVERSHHMSARTRQVKELAIQQNTVVSGVEQASSRITQITDENKNMVFELSRIAEQLVQASDSISAMMFNYKVDDSR